MLPRLEYLAPKPGRSFLARSFNLPRFPFVWHVHPEVELTLILEGRGRRYVGDAIDDFTEGDLVLLGPNLPHSWHSEREPRRRSRSIVVQFPAAVLGQDGMRLPEINTVNRLLDRASFGLQVTGTAAAEVAKRMEKMPRLAPLSLLLELLSILHTLGRSRHVRELSGRAYATPPRQEDRHRIDRVSRLIHDRIRDDGLRQNEAARSVHMSSASFSRYFKQATGRTFVRYLHELRVSHACRLLQETDRPITEVCYDTGFGNLSNFNRIFRRLQRTTPRDYRARFMPDPR